MAYKKSSAGRLENHPYNRRTYRRVAGLVQAALAKKTPAQQKRWDEFWTKVWAAKPKRSEAWV